MIQWSYGGPNESDHQWFITFFIDLFKHLLVVLRHLNGKFSKYSFLQTEWKIQANKIDVECLVNETNAQYNSFKSN